MHKPVMLEQVTSLLVRDGAKLFFDGTLGGGGHAQALLDAAGDGSRLVGIDRDEGALERVREKFAGYGERVILRHANFDGMKAVAEEAGFGSVDGVILDIGYSSMQIDDAERGFSFGRSGLLDMRMDRTEDLTAAMIVNGYGEVDLADVIYRYGEERASRRIAKAIVRRRSEQSFTDTLDLAEVVSRAMGGRKGRIHPATRVFQALRIEVNRELECLEKGLRQGVDLLGQGGRMAVISFHSLEDRMVKYFFRGLAADGGSRSYTVVTRKPVTAADEETESNPRARSAKLRVVERTE